jgi:hypothetical protein
LKIFRAEIKERTFRKGIVGKTLLQKASVPPHGLTGIDLAHDIGIGRFQQTGDRRGLPTPSVVRKVTEGKFGEKTGEGWYKHEK